MQINETLTRLTKLDIENELLGSTFIKDDVIKHIFIKEEVLSNPMNQYTLYLMRKSDEEGLNIDVSTLINEATKERKVDPGEFYKHITHLASTSATAANVMYKQNELLELYMKREQIKMAHYIISNAEKKTYSEIDYEIKNQMVSIEGSIVDNDDGHISDVMKEVLLDLETSKGSLSGSPTHMRDLDNIMKGLRKQELVVIGAQPSTGKTVMAVNVAQNHALENEGVSIVFSLEMGSLSIGKRLLSAHSNIHSEKINNAMEKFTDKDWNNSVNSIGVLSQLGIHILEDDNVTVEHIKRKSRSIAEKYKGADKHICIFIDYLGLIKGSGQYKGNKRLEMSHIAIQLKSLAKELNATVVVLSQLSRDNEKDKRKPMMQDLKESSDIEAASDVIILLHREDYQDRETEKKNIIEIIVAKNRNGSTGTAEMTFLKHLSKFVDIG